MFAYRSLVAGACLLSVTGYAAAHAEILADAVASEAPVARVQSIPPVAEPQPARSAPAVPAAAAAPAPTLPSAPAAAQPSARAGAAATAPDRELTCLAKVVLHEAGNQSRAGQLAVAQVVMNRVRSPRFPNTICGVVLQRGQFFNVHAYNPPRDARWRRALEVARDAREGISAPVVGNALFFRATYASSAFFESRTRVATLGDHVFYR